MKWAGLLNSIYCNHYCFMYLELSHDEEDYQYHAVSDMKKKDQRVLGTKKYVKSQIALIA